MGVYILFIGVLIFLGHLFFRVFILTRIPDLLLLMLLGILIGPVLGLVSTDSFGVFGTIFPTLTLVIILFEGGLNLKIDTVLSTFRDATALTFFNFFTTLGVSAYLIYTILGYPVISSLMFGAILGATSSAVVIPLLPQLRLREESRTILSIESAFSDVISIVVVLTMLKIATSPEVNFISLSEAFFISVLLALCLGILAALGWAVIRKQFQIFDSLFATPAFMFIIYGLLEMSGLSGAIGVLTFGITLGNMDYFKPRVFTENFNTYILNRKDFDPGEIELNSTERFFFAEIVFLFKTFFFIYIGISMQFLGAPVVMAGILLTLLLFLLRVPVIWASIPKTTPKWDAGIMAIMVPKGLAAAVLASLPLQAGIIGGEFIRDTTFAVIFFSITMNAALIFLMEKTPVKRIYYIFFTEYGREKNISHGK